MFRALFHLNKSIKRNASLAEYKTILKTLQSKQKKSMAFIGPDQRMVLKCSIKNAFEISAWPNQLKS